MTKDGTRPILDHKAAIENLFDLVGPLQHALFVEDLPATEPEIKLVVAGVIATCGRSFLRVHSNRCKQQRKHDRCATQDSLKNANHLIISFLQSRVGY